MRLISTLLLLFAVYICAGQKSTDNVIITGNCWGKPKADTAKVDPEKGLTGRVTGLNTQNGAARATPIIIRCAKSVSYNLQPLYVLDGIVTPIEKLGTLNPNDIFNIEILKDKEATDKYGQDAAGGVILIYTKLNWLVVVNGMPCDADTIRKIPVSTIVSADTLWAFKQAQVVGCRPPRNVILITTNIPSQRYISVRDASTGEHIAGATVSYISTGRDETFQSIADENGLAVADKLQKDAAYTMMVSCAGYKTLKQVVINKPGSFPGMVLLEKDVKQCSPVILSSIICYRKIRCGFMVKVIREKAEAEKTTVATDSFRFYPNPVMKGGTITLEWNDLSARPAEYRLFSLNGSLLQRLPVPGKAESGVMQISMDSRRASGVYFLQLVCENGRVLASGKIILQ